MSRVSTNYWRLTSNQRKKFNDIGETLNVMVLSDWEGKTQRDIVTNGGSGILKKYNGSIHNAVSSIYPERNWVSYLFHHSPRGVWSEVSMMKHVFNDIAKKYNITVLSGWYTLTFDDMDTTGKMIINYKFNGSLSAALNELFPKHDWKPWLFKHVPHGVWEDIENQVGQLDVIARDLSVKVLDDWYRIPHEVISDNDNRLLLLHNNSLPTLLKTLYPNHKWQAWKFYKDPKVSVPKKKRPKFHFLANKFLLESEKKEYLPSQNVLINQRLEFDIIGHNIGIKTLSDWYDVSYKDIYDKGARDILSRYNGSLSCFLKTAYPAFQWASWRLNKHKPSHYAVKHWSLEYNQKAFLRHLEQVLDIRDPLSWYHVSQSQISRHGGHSILSYYPAVLNTIHPTIEWQTRLFSSKVVAKKSQQHALKRYSLSLFD